MKRYVLCLFVILVLGYAPATAASRNKGAGTGIYTVALFPVKVIADWGEGYTQQNEVLAVEGIANLGSSSIRRTLAEAVGAAEGRSRGVGVEAGKKEAILDITVNVIYGFVIPNIIIELRQKVATRLLEMVGLIAKEINVDVVGIEFPERMPGKLA